MGRVRLVHSAIPLSTADSLGVPSLMSKVLNAEEVSDTNTAESRYNANAFRRNVVPVQSAESDRLTPALIYHQL